MKKLVLTILLMTSSVFATPTQQEIVQRAQIIDQRLNKEDLTESSKNWLRGYHAGLIYALFGDIEL